MNYDLDISLDIDNNSFSGNIRDVLQINEGNLTEEFTKQPSIFAWFATLCEIASIQVEEKKLEISRMQANLDKELRGELSKGKIKVTEAMVSSAITTDERMITLADELIEITRQYKILRALTKSLDQRSTMLVQLGTMKRQEMVLDDFGIDLKKVRKQQ